LERFRGIGASDGIVIGPAQVWRRARIAIDRRRAHKRAPHDELRRLEEALRTTSEELAALRDQLQLKLGSDHASILDAQLLVLEDEEFLAAVRQAIEREGMSAEAAFARATAEALIPLDLSGDGLFQERMTDFRDVEQRVLRALSGGGSTVPQLEEPRVLVASQLTPSETAALDVGRVLGFCLDEGTVSSHTAIIARSLGVPAVVGLRTLSRHVHDGISLAVDGTTGVVHVDPTAETLRRFDARIRRRREVEERLLTLKDVPAETPDGRTVEISANVDLPLEIDLAVASGAQGIGLLRTEYFYFQSTTIPAEDVQLAAYRRALEGAEGGTVIFRVLDVGGDKFIASMGGYREYNPFLGWRGARFLLSNPELLHTQLRALYRASAFGPLKIMFPMITGVEELQKLQEQCRRCRDELAAEGHAFDPDVALGIMVETPSAVALAHELAALCDFFSIGTNDLTQYVLAVDRSNAKVSHLYSAHHPAVLRAIRDTIEAGHAEGIWVATCGEAAANPMYAVLLLGLGIDSISTHAASIPVVKKVIRTISYDQARSWAQEALALPTAAAVEEFLKQKAHERLRDFLQGNG
jgi:phosphotransferase system enzyme I (PtsI)